MNEERLVRSLTELFPPVPGVLEGIGDDCAVLEGLSSDTVQLAAVDQVIENVHFLPGEMPEKIAGKLIRRNVSDIAAMCGVPRYALLSLALHAPEEDYLLRFHRAIAEECRFWKMGIIGGDVSALPEEGKVFSLTILGEAKKSCVRSRSGAQAGDLLLGTGTYGRSFESGHHLDFLPRLPEGQFLGTRPEVHAVMDVSDGLLKDALRMADGAGLALELSGEKAPARDHASVEDRLCDGEDYELLFAVRPDAAETLIADWPFEEKPHVFGSFQPGPRGRWLNAIPLTKKGYDHFHE